MAGPSRQISLACIKLALVQRNVHAPGAIFIVCQDQPIRRCHGVLRADFAVPARWKPNSTPLHIAAARGSTTMVKHMLQAYVSWATWPEIPCTSCAMVDSQASFVRAVPATGCGTAVVMM